VSDVPRLPIIVMHPDMVRLINIELGPGTYAEKCAARERIRYDRRLAALRSPWTSEDLAAAAAAFAFDRR